MVSNRRVYSSLVSTRHARLALLVVLAAAGFGGAYAVAGIASVDSATATPKPDPPPTTHRAPLPPPPPPAVPPPPPVAPPPPPPPAETYAPPPPPPVVQTRVMPVVHKVIERERPRQKQTRQTVAPTAVTWLPRPPDAPRPKMLTTVSAAATTGAPASWSSGLALLLWPALGLALIGVLMAALPPWVLPAPVSARVYERREALLTGGLAATVSIAVGVVVALLGS